MIWFGKILEGRHLIERGIYWSKYRYVVLKAKIKRATGAVSRKTQKVAPSSQPLICSLGCIPHSVMIFYSSKVRQIGLPIVTRAIQTIVCFFCSQKHSGAFSRYKFYFISFGQLLYGLPRYIVACIISLPDCGHVVLITFIFVPAVTGVFVHQALQAAKMGNTSFIN